jgi:DNA-binding winged helix-turn-helix (wHTH) protein
LNDLFAYCGGHPYFTKLILQHILHHCEEYPTPVEVSSAILNESIYLALSDPRTDLVMENLYRVHFSNQEKEMFLLLARRQGALPTKELSAAGHNWVAVARRLVRRYYLVEDLGGIRFRFSFMHEWLRNWICFEEECVQLNTLQDKLEVPPEIEVNLSSGQVFVLGVPVKLSAQEFNIMDYLSKRAGELVHREDLIDKVWEASQGVSDQVVDTAFYRLRKRIGDQGQYIETIPGQGFRLSHVVRIPGPGRRSHADQKGESE